MNNTSDPDLINSALQSYSYVHRNTQTTSDFGARAHGTPFKGLACIIKLPKLGLVILSQISRSIQYIALVTIVWRWTEGTVGHFRGFLLCYYLDSYIVCCMLILSLPRLMAIFHTIIFICDYFGGKENHTNTAAKLQTVPLSWNTTAVVGAWGGHEAQPWCPWFVLVCCYSGENHNSLLSSLVYLGVQATKCQLRPNVFIQSPVKR